MNQMNRVFRTVAGSCLLLGVVVIAGCGSSAPTTATQPAAPTPAAPAAPVTSPVTLGVFLLEAHAGKHDTGEVAFMSIDGTDLALSNAVSGGGGFLTTTGAAQLTKGTHIALVSLSQTSLPEINIGGNVSGVVQVQGSAITHNNGPCVLSVACAWAGTVPSSFTGTVGLTFTVF